MGRKGNSKRKPSKTKSGPVSIGGSSSAGSFGNRMADTLPALASDRSKAAPVNRGGIKPSSKH